MVSNEGEIMWQNIIKNQGRITQVYNEFKRRNPHLWEEAQQLAGQGEVAILDGIVLHHIRQNLNSHDLMQTLTDVAEAYILQD